MGPHKNGCLGIPVNSLHIPCTRAKQLAVYTGTTVCHHVLEWLAEEQIMEGHGPRAWPAVKIDNLRRRPSG